MHCSSPVSLVSCQLWVQHYLHPFEYRSRAAVSSWGAAAAGRLLLRNATHLTVSPPALPEAPWGNTIKLAAYSRGRWPGPSSDKGALCLLRLTAAWLLLLAGGGLW